MKYALVTLVLLGSFGARACDNFPMQIEVRTQNTQTHCITRENVVFGNKTLYTDCY